MVYLLKSGPYLKIGFTSQPSLESRLHQIRNASPYDLEVLAARPGTYEQEQELHRGAKQWQHRGDWYNDCPELRVYCDRFFYPNEGDPNGTPAEGGGGRPPRGPVGNSELDWVAGINTMTEPSIDEMISDLIGGGWTKVRSDVWEAPWGALFYGPHKAWHIWAGTPMCEPK